MSIRLPTWRWRAVPRALALAAFLGAAPATAFAQAQLPPALTTPTSRTLEQLQRSATQPVPTVPPRPVPRPDMVWVPDRYVRVPGTAGLAHVPAHWERQTPDGESYVPPLTAVTPEGPVVLFPAGKYPPADRRPAP